MTYSDFVINIVAKTLPHTRSKWKMKRKTLRIKYTTSQNA